MPGPSVRASRSSRAPPRHPRRPARPRARPLRSPAGTTGARHRASGRTPCPPRRGASRRRPRHRTSSGRWRYPEPEAVPRPSVSIPAVEAETRYRLESVGVSAPAERSPRRSCSRGRPSDERLLRGQPGPRELADRGPEVAARASLAERERGQVRAGGHRTQLVCVSVPRERDLRGAGVHQEDHRRRRASRRDRPRGGEEVGGRAAEPADGGGERGPSIPASRSAPIASSGKRPSRSTSAANSAASSRAGATCSSNDIDRLPSVSGTGTRRELRPTSSTEGSRRGCSRPTGRRPHALICVARRTSSSPRGHDTGRPSRLAANSFRG